MNYIFKFPDIGEGLDEGTIVEWQVKKGQQVNVGDALVTMETDKVVTDIPSPRAGIIASLYGKVGEIVKVGNALVEIQIEGTVSEVLSDSKIEVVQEEGAGVVGTLEIAGNNAVLTASNEFISSAKQEKTINKKVLATPVARALAKDLGVDIDLITGTGPAQRVMKDDILKFVEKKTSLKPKTSSTQVETTNEQLVEIEPITQIRRTIAKNMIQSKHNAAHMTVFDEVEISELTRIRSKYKENYSEKNVKLTYLSFILKATALSLKKFKSLNSEMDMENNKMIYKKYYNIGIAVDTEKGLMVPVIKNVDKLSIFEIASKIQEYSEKAQSGKLSLDDFKDGTFTITSYGSIGGRFAVPVINYPQAAILGIGKISKQPVVLNDEIKIGQVLPLSLSVDHRITDGGEATRFLNAVMHYLNEPVSLMME
jgi:pyruvate dehydrogenase E2 component (dihydrolipoamide acetyltransferase)